MNKLRSLGLSLVVSICGLCGTLQTNVDRVLSGGDDASSKVGYEAFRGEAKSAPAGDALIGLRFLLILGDDCFCLCSCPENGQ